MKKKKALTEVDEKVIRSLVTTSKKGLRVFAHIFDEHGHQVIEPQQIVALRSTLSSMIQNGERSLRGRQRIRNKK